MQAAIELAIRALGYRELREKQAEVVESFVRGNDVFGVLPTGYGKSLCYACLPATFDALAKRDHSSIVVVVTPLVAIMNDQVRTWSELGLPAACITSESPNVVKDGVMMGKYQLVFFTPELLIKKAKWRELLTGALYSARIVAFVVDEAHCVKKWGDTFRTTLKRIGEIRSLLPQHVHVMALTATATRKLLIAVEGILGMKKPVVVSVPPCKANISYAVGTFTSIPETFSPVLERLRKERQLMPRMIVYCRTYNMCANLYHYFRTSLSCDFTEPPSSADLNKHALVNMFLGCTPPDVKREITRQFTDARAPLRVIFATSAFGMGVDCRDVRQVIHLGVTEDTEAYIQGTGRAGRDARPALALLLQHGRSNTLADKDILEYQGNETVCRRDFLFRDVGEYKHEDLGVKCLCCDICAAKCDCGQCVENHTYFQFIGKKINRYQ